MAVSRHGITIDFPGNEWKERKVMNPGEGLLEDGFAVSTRFGWIKTGKCPQGSI